ncbi:MAG: hypothetical protein U9N34_08740, partial [Candidatus Cloacimonadota bacterium]|nr:hypothetical protein [Candidatus Cloacimonadota bacterium]
MIDLKKSGLFDTEKFQQGITAGLKAIYPIESDNRILSIDSVDFDKSDLDPNDWADIKDAFINKKSIETPVKAKFTLSDKDTGKKISTHKINIGSVPVMSRLGTYVIDGNQYTMPLQLRLKAGAYARISEKGETEVFNNVENGRPIRTQIDPEKQLLKLKIGQGTIPIYPLLKTLDMDDDTIKKSLGDSIFQSNKDVPYDSSVRKTYKAIFKETMGDIEEGKARIKEHFGQLRTNPKVNKEHLGESFDTVSPEYLLATAKKVIDITNGSAKPDNRDALRYKEAYGIEDFMQDRLENYAGSYASKTKALKNMDKETSIGKLVDKKGLQKQLKEVFTASQLSRYASQSSPISILNSPFLTTLLGEGGIGSQVAVPGDAKLLQNSHMGFLDSSHTPESKSAGITLTLAMDTIKAGKELKTRVINIKTGRNEWKTSDELSREAL